MQKNMNLSLLTDLSEELGVVAGSQMKGENKEIGLEERTKLRGRAWNDYS